MAKVRRLYASTIRGDTSSDLADGIEGPGVIHIQGVFLIGTDTLCGHADRTDYTWHDTKKAPTCKGCLAIWNFVKSQEL